MGRSAAGDAKQPPKYPIDSVNNALRLLSLVGNHPAVRVSDIADDLGVAVSTAHRLLAQMEYGDFIVQDEVSRMYRPGTALLDLAQMLSPGESLGYARPVMQELAERIRETVSLQVLRGSDVLFLESVEAPQLLRVSSRAGAVLPAHCVSGGKALLSQLTEQQIIEMYPKVRLPQVTENSITDRRVLLAELDKVRRLGYATNFGESEPEVSGVGVVIPVADGLAARALAVGAPKSRLSKRRVVEIAEALRESASTLAEEMTMAARR
jgi:IclR family acetate operon transcriptional repressor